MITPSVGGAYSLVNTLVLAVGALLGGMATLAGVTVVGAAMRAVGITAHFINMGVVLSATVVATFAVLGKTIEVPSGCWLVPRAWQAFGGLRYAGLFGFNLGLGWRTRVTSWSFWIMLAVLLGADARRGLLMVWCFALTRALPVVAIAWHRMRSDIRTGQRHADLMRDLGRSWSTGIIAQAVLIAVAIAAWKSI